MDGKQGRRDPLTAAIEVEPVRRPAGEIDRLFREHHALVFRAAYRITGNTGDAEDVLQNVFLRLMRREAGTETVENVESYLYRAAVNAALDLMRSRQKGADVPLEDLETALVDDSSLAPDRTLASGEIREWLRASIARLSPRAAEIFVLRFFEGLDNPEIARVLETTPASIAVTLHRTRERIEQEFRAYWGANR